MLSQKELLNLPELLNAHAAMIEKAEAEQAMCQDEPLRQILQRHSQVYRRHYGQLQWMLDRARGQGAARPPAGHYHGDARWVHGNGQATQASSPLNRTGRRRPRATGSATAPWRWVAWR